MGAEDAAAKKDDGGEGDSSSSSEEDDANMGLTQCDIDDLQDLGLDVSKLKARRRDENDGGKYQEDLEAEDAFGFGLNSQHGSAGRQSQTQGSPPGSVGRQSQKRVAPSIQIEEEDDVDKGLTPGDIDDLRDLGLDVSKLKARRLDEKDGGKSKLFGS